MTYFALPCREHVTPGYPDGYESSAAYHRWHTVSPSLLDAADTAWNSAAKVNKELEELTPVILANTSTLPYLLQSIRDVTVHHCKRRTFGSNLTCVHDARALRDLRHLVFLAGVGIL